MECFDCSEYYYLGKLRIDTNINEQIITSTIKSQKIRKSNILVNGVLVDTVIRDTVLNCSAFSRSYKNHYLIKESLQLNSLGRIRESKNRVVKYLYDFSDPQKIIVKKHITDSISVFFNDNYTTNIECLTFIFYFNNDSLLVREEMARESSNPNIFQRKTSLYEYDTTNPIPHLTSKIETEYTDNSSSPFAITCSRYSHQLSSNAMNTIAYRERTEYKDQRNRPLAVPLIKKDSIYNDVVRDEREFKAIVNPGTLIKHYYFNSKMQLDSLKIANQRLLILQRILLSDIPIILMG